MPLTHSSHIIGLLRGRGAGGYLVLPVVPVKVWFKKSIFSPPKVLLLTLHLTYKASLVNGSDWLDVMSVGDPVNVIMTGETQTCHLKHL